jgi:hypothetical protein
VRPLAVLRWIPIAVACALASLLAFAIAPIAVARMQGPGRLPRWGRWLETPDALELPIDALYEPAIAWTLRKLGWRAAALRWRFVPLIPLVPKHDLGIWPSDDAGVPGSRFLAWRNPDGQRAFEWYAVKPIGRGLCLRVRLGWKLAPFFDPVHRAHLGDGLPVIHVSVRRFGPQA